MKNCHKRKGVWMGEGQREGSLHKLLGGRKWRCVGASSRETRVGSKCLFWYRGGEEVIHKQFKSRALVLLRCFPMTTHRRVCIEGEGEEVMLQGLEEQAE